MDTNLNLDNLCRGPPPPLPAPAHPYLLLDVGVSVQHESRRSSILLGWQGHTKAEHDRTQLVPEVGLILGKGARDGPACYHVPCLPCMSR